MDKQNFNQFQDPIEVQTVKTGDAAKAFIARVFTWMFIGLATTGIIAKIFAVSGLISILYSPTGGMSILGYVVMFAPFGLVLLMGGGFRRLSTNAMVLTFLAFSALMGMSLSFIFLAYTSTSIFSIFFIAAGMFAIMAVLGYTTSTDLTRFGNLMYMLLFGIIIAMVVNFFMHSSALQYAISFICVAIFTGLTAYDVQMLKQIGGGQMNVQSQGIFSRGRRMGAMQNYASTDSSDASMGKLAIYGALMLYLDFINLFLALLQIFGARKN